MTAHNRPLRRYRRLLARILRRTATTTPSGKGYKARTIAECLAAGWIERAGDGYRLTGTGHYVLSAGVGR